MKPNQLTRGQVRRLMYIENKDGLIDGADARIGWVTFSHSGRTVYYQGRSLRKKTREDRAGGNFVDTQTGDIYWVSGIKKRGSNAHLNVKTLVMIDDDAKEEYQKKRGE